MSTLNFPVEKIPDEELRSFAVAQAPERRMVLIELQLPVRQVELQRTDAGDGARHVPVRVRPQTPEQRQEVERKTAAVRQFLTQVLEEQSDWLPAARAFAAKVNGEQLTKIAQFPLIKVVRPNRHFSMRVAR
jgi:hypothetical protein